MTLFRRRVTGKGKAPDRIPAALPPPSLTHVYVKKGAGAGMEERPTNQKPPKIHRARTFLPWPLALAVAALGYASYLNPSYANGLAVGASAAILIVYPIIDRMGPGPYYRRWYIMCRNELEKIDPNNRALKKIGPRQSPHEEWEESIYLD